MEGVIPSDTVPVDSDVLVKELLLRVRALELENERLKRQSIEMHNEKHEHLGDMRILRETKDLLDSSVSQSSPRHISASPKERKRHSCPDSANILGGMNRVEGGTMSTLAREISVDTTTASTLRNFLSGNEALQPFLLRRNNSTSTENIKRPTVVMASSSSAIDLSSNNRANSISSVIRKNVCNATSSGNRDRVDRSTELSIEPSTVVGIKEINPVPAKTVNSRVETMDATIKEKKSSVVAVGYGDRHLALSRRSRAGEYTDTLRPLLGGNAMCGAAGLRQTKNLTHKLSDNTETSSSPSQSLEPENYSGSSDSPAAFSAVGDSPGFLRRAIFGRDSDIEKYVSQITRDKEAISGILEASESINMKGEKETISAMSFSATAYESEHLNEEDNPMDFNGAHRVTASHLIMLPPSPSGFRLLDATAPNAVVDASEYGVYGVDYTAVTRARPRLSICLRLAEEQKGLDSDLDSDENTLDDQDDEMDIMVPAVPTTSSSRSSPASIENNLEPTPSYEDDRTTAINGSVAFEKVPFEFCVAEADFEALVQYPVDYSGKMDAFFVREQAENEEAKEQPRNENGDSIGAAEGIARARPSSPLSPPLWSSPVSSRARVNQADSVALQEDSLPQNRDDDGASLGSRVTWRYQHNDGVQRDTAAPIAGVDRLDCFCFPSGVSVDVCSVSSAEMLISPSQDSFHILQFSGSVSQSSPAPPAAGFGGPPVAPVTYACCLVIGACHPLPPIGSDAREILIRMSMKKRAAKILQKAFKYYLANAKRSLWLHAQKDSFYSVALSSAAIPLSTSTTAADLAGVGAFTQPSSSVRILSSSTSAQPSHSLESTTKTSIGGFAFQTRNKSSSSSFHVGARSLPANTNYDGDEREQQLSTGLPPTTPVKSSIATSSSSTSFFNRYFGSVSKRATTSRKLVHAEKNNLVAGIVDIGTNNCENPERNGGDQDSLKAITTTTITAMTDDKVNVGLDRAGPGISTQPRNVAFRVITEEPTPSSNDREPSYLDSTHQFDAVGNIDDDIERNEVLDTPTHCTDGQSGAKSVSTASNTSNSSPRSFASCIEYTGKNNKNVNQLGYYVRGKDCDDSLEGRYEDCVQDLDAHSGTKLSYAQKQQQQQQQQQHVLGGDIDRGTGHRISPSFGLGAFCSSGTGLLDSVDNNSTNSAMHLKISPRKSSSHHTTHSSHSSHTVMSTSCLDGIGAGGYSNGVGVGLCSGSSTVDGVDMKAHFKTKKSCSVATVENNLSSYTQLSHHDQPTKSDSIQSTVRHHSQPGKSGCDTSTATAINKAISISRSGSSTHKTKVHDKVVVTRKAYCIVMDAPQHALAYRILTAIANAERVPASSCKDMRDANKIVHARNAVLSHCAGIVLSASQLPFNPPQQQQQQQREIPSFHGNNNKHNVSKLDINDINALSSTNEWTMAVLLSCLTPGQIFKIMNLLLQEKSVVIVGNDLGIVSALSHAFLQLLDPFPWEGVFVPVVPENARDLFGAPVPFILGTAHIPSVDSLSPQAAVLEVHGEVDPLATIPINTTTADARRVIKYTAWFFRLPDVTADMPIDDALNWTVDSACRFFTRRTSSSPSSSFSPSSTISSVCARYITHMTESEKKCAITTHRTITLHNARLAEQLLFRPWAWKQSVRYNASTKQEEFSPQLFLEPAHTRIEFQEALASTQLFCGLIDRLRLESAERDTLREFLFTWLKFRFHWRRRRIGRLESQA